VRPEGLEPPTF